MSNLEYFLNNPTKPEVHVTYSSHSSSRDSSSSSKSSSNDSSSSKSSSSSSDSSSSKSLSSNSSSKSSSSDSSSSSSKDSSSTKSSSSSWLSKSSYDDDDDRRSSDEPIREESSSSDDSNDFFALKPKKETPATTPATKKEPTPQLAVNSSAQKTITEPDKQSTQIAAPADKKFEKKVSMYAELGNRFIKLKNKYPNNEDLQKCIESKAAFILALHQLYEIPVQVSFDFIAIQCHQKKYKDDTSTHDLLKNKESENATRSYVQFEYGFHDNNPQPNKGIHYPQNGLHTFHPDQNFQFNNQQILNRKFTFSNNGIQEHFVLKEKCPSIGNIFDLDKETQFELLEKDILFLQAVQTIYDFHTHKISAPDYVERIMKIQNEIYQRDHPGLKERFLSWLNGTAEEEPLIEQTQRIVSPENNQPEKPISTLGFLLILAADHEKINDPRFQEAKEALDLLSNLQNFTGCSQTRGFSTVQSNDKDSQTLQVQPSAVKKTEPDQAPATAQPETNKPSAASTGQTSDQKSVKKDSSSTSDSSAKKAAKKIDDSSSETSFDPQSTKKPQFVLEKKRRADRFARSCIRRM